MPKMGDDIIAAQRQHSRMGNNLRKLRLSRTWTLQEAADAFGMSRSGYQKIERGERSLDEQMITRASKIYNVSEGLVIAESAGVLLVGEVGAGHELRFYPDSSEPEEVAAPPDVHENTVAIRVAGGPMAEYIEDGAILYYQDDRTPPHDDLIGKLCVVRIEDGRTLVRKMAKGSEYDRWHLFYLSAAPMYDQRVEWAARVTWVRPSE